MNNETKLTAADLALYLGCEVYAETPTASGSVHVRKGRLVGIRPAETRRINPITIDVETESGGVIDMYFLPEQIKPILRPLSDMTEDEAMFWAGFFEGQTAMSTQSDKVAFALRLMDSHCCQESVRYLLSRHFDLFGWIDACLAIDKTKTETP